LPQHADILINHARCFTADPANPSADAVAVRGHRIVFVGTDADADAFRGLRTRVIDARLRTLMPGFIDSHYHLLTGSIELGHAQLGEVQSYDALREALRAFADEHPRREWLAGYGLPYLVLPGERMLTRRDLDAIESDRPLFVMAYDGHTVWANTEALRRAGLLKDGKTVAPNSEIVLGDDGLAGGELREPGAYRPMLDLVPEPNDADKRALLRRGLRQAAELGVTSVHNMNGDADELALYAALEDLGEMTLRIYVPYSVRPDTPFEALAGEAVALREMHHTDTVRAGAVKFFMDGVIESYTGLLLDDYEGRPGPQGDANFSAEHFNRMAIEADRLGLQIFVHAIGDAAVRRTLDGYAAAQRVNGKRDSRHRVEHIELIHPDDLARFRQLGVIASMQPLHAPTSASGIDVWPSRVGQGRWDRSFAWRSLREAGARLAFGSDWPVVSQNPMRGVHAALNRRPWREGGLEHRQTLTDTLIAYTRDAAYAGFQEDQIGQLKAGMLADVVMLSRDLFAVPVEEMDQVKPVLTMHNGKIVLGG
jgi:predicted amidohydrolase YtcJ